MGKGLNRSIGTLIGGALGLGAHYLAALSGPKGEPILIGVMVFVLGKSKAKKFYLSEDGSREFFNGQLRRRRFRDFYRKLKRDSTMVR